MNFQKIRAFRNPVMLSKPILFFFVFFVCLFFFHKQHFTQSPQTLPVGGYVDQSFRRARSLEKNGYALGLRNPTSGRSSWGCGWEGSWGVRTRWRCHGSTVDAVKTGISLNAHSRRQLVKFICNLPLEDEAAVRNYFLLFPSFPSSFFTSFFFPFSLFLHKYLLSA